MVYKSDQVPWSLYVGWAFTNLSEEINLQASRVIKKRFDFMILPFFPPLT
jgi:hypothetical protein